MSVDVVRVGGVIADRVDRGDHGGTWTVEERKRGGVAQAFRVMREERRKVWDSPRKRSWCGSSGVAKAEQLHPQDRLVLEHVLPLPPLLTDGCPSESLKFSRDGTYESPERSELFYDIEDVLGLGMDTVLLGVAKGTSMQVAIKRISKERSSEVDTMCRLRHDNLINSFGRHVCVEEDFIDVVMEYMRGGDLFEFLSHQKEISESNVCLVIKQVLSALEYVHDMGVVHCDVKAENVLLSSKSFPLKVKLADFGIAELATVGIVKRCSSEASDVAFRQTSPLGTPGYMAPELCEYLLDASNDAEGCTPFFPTPAVDLFACGVLLYVMLSGSFPDFYAGESVEEIYRKTADAKFSMEGREWYNVSPEARNLVRSLLRREPSERPTAKEALASSWFQAEVSDKPIGNDLTAANLAAKKLTLCAYMTERSRYRKHRRRQSEVIYYEEGGC
mmetsp:Transcript_1185/g.3674  ORF Transcript_1185/g.3674 Transcript_1185/m.3674 type:complete len:446 (-) Transcript_1185:996-2333(-)